MLARWLAKPIGLTPQEHQPFTCWALIWKPAWWLCKFEFVIWNMIFEIVINIIYSFLYCCDSIFLGIVWLKLLKYIFKLILQWSYNKIWRYKTYINKIYKFVGIFKVENWDPSIFDFPKKMHVFSSFWIFTICTSFDTFVETFFGPKSIQLTSLDRVSAIGGPKPVIFRSTGSTRKSW